MDQRVRNAMAVLVPALLLVGLSACNSGRYRAQSQSERDAEMRQKVADDTVKAKEDARVAARQLEDAARQTGHDAKVAAQGVKEGWNRDKQGRLDLNTASRADLRSLGLSEVQATEVINQRPYNNKGQLLDRGVLTRREYDDIQDKVTVISPSPQR
jgi:DNA uptake protein ComE-like DNA-binding protein